MFSSEKGWLKGVCMGYARQISWISWRGEKTNKQSKTTREQLFSTTYSIRGFTGNYQNVSLNETVILHAARETSGSCEAFCQKMLWSPRHLPARSGSKAAALVQNRRSTKHRTQVPHGPTTEAMAGWREEEGGRTLLQGNSQAPTSWLRDFLTCGWCLCISKCPMSMCTPFSNQ